MRVNENGTTIYCLDDVTVVLDWKEHDIGRLFCLECKVEVPDYSYNCLHCGVSGPDGWMRIIGADSGNFELEHPTQGDA
tara:strand:+ start:610 stop:846 length:237 start_codon:yes stop_codon:yes gene_type:complete